MAQNVKWQMYGMDMVVFGFAFNQGVFQAVEPQRALRAFTVPAAPTDSLDATLAATGIALLALDLRGIEPHQSRSIGASFSDSTAAQYLMRITAPRSCDPLLFVEKTTAARKN